MENTTPTARIERQAETPIYSHVSFEDEAAFVCHHSGRYLTKRETNPIWTSLFLREQHDFPGLPLLDRAFSKAAHSEMHQHVRWSRISIQGATMMGLSIVFAGLSFYLFFQQAYVPDGLVLYGAIALWVGLVLFSTFLLVRGFQLFVNSVRHFHRRAADVPPGVTDYPLLGRYRVNIREELNVNLTNTREGHPAVRTNKGNVTATFLPHKPEWETFEAFRNQYAAHTTQSFVHGGMVALSNLANTEWRDGSPLEFDHRLVLRKAVTADAFNANGELDAFGVSADYSITPAALYPTRNGVVHFPLECEPRLSARDSRTLELHFNWHGPTHSICRLEECVLELPPELGLVTRVTLGRYDQTRDEIIWRNRRFHKQHLKLEVSFEKPILKKTDAPLLLEGSYRFYVDSTLSGLTAQPAHIWNVMGLPIEEADCDIQHHTHIAGTITIAPQRLSQEHEHVRHIPVIECHQPPTDALVEKATKTLETHCRDITLRLHKGRGGSSGTCAQCE